MSSSERLAFHFNNFSASDGSATSSGGSPGRRAVMWVGTLCPVMRSTAVTTSFTEYPARLHAPFVTEKEIASVVEFWRTQGTAEYDQKFLEAPKEERQGAGIEGGEEGSGDEHDPLFEDAVRLVLEFGKASTSLLQRRLRIGYGRAAHLIDLMERDGIVGAADGPKPREVLKRPSWITEVEESMR